MDDDPIFRLKDTAIKEIAIMFYKDYMNLTDLSSHYFFLVKQRWVNVMFLRENLNGYGFYIQMDPRDK